MVLDKLRPSEIVSALLMIILVEMPRLKSYISVIMLFMAIRNIVKLVSGEFIGYGTAYVINKVADAIECLA